MTLHGVRSGIQRRQAPGTVWGTYLSLLCSPLPWVVCSPPGRWICQVPRSHPLVRLSDCIRGLFKDFTLSIFIKTEMEHMHGIYWKQEKHVCLLHFCLSLVRFSMYTSGRNIHCISCYEMTQQVWKPLLLHHSKLSEQSICAASWKGRARNKRAFCPVHTCTADPRPRHNHSLIGAYGVCCPALSDL